MKALQKPFLFFLAAITTALAAPVVPLGALLPHHESRILPRQQTITQPVTFQTVETTQTQVGTITQTCKITLTPITDSSGTQLFREDKECTYVVLPPGQSPPPPASTSGSAAPPDQTPANGQATTTTSSDPGTTTTSGNSSTPSPTPDPNATSSSTSASSTSSSTPDPNATSSSTSATSSATTSTPVTTNPAADSNTATGANAPAASDSPAATPVTVTSTLANGAVTTLTLPSAAQAQTSATQEEVPGRKLEVLPIGLGVFAGISVIALIVVGLVTYERTKYRRAFRQRKLAEDGANMGYGGMAERT